MYSNEAGVIGSIPARVAKKPNEVPVSTWNRTSSGLPTVRYGAPAGIHNRMCMERACSLPTVLVLVASHALVAKFGSTRWLQNPVRKGEGSSPSRGTHVG